MMTEPGSPIHMHETSMPRGRDPQAKKNLAVEHLLTARKDKENLPLHVLNVPFPSWLWTSGPSTPLGFCLQCQIWRVRKGPYAPERPGCGLTASKYLLPQWLAQTI